MRETLEKALGPVHWSDLRAHAARGAIVIVAPELDMVDVGVALARDEVEVVQVWLHKGQLRKPSLEDLEAWSKVTGEGWDALVIAPYVLVRERASGTA